MPNLRPYCFGFLPRAVLVALLVALCGCQMPFGRKSTLAPEPGANKNPCVVLALPASGNYAAIAAKIKKGANAAAQDLRARGINVRLENLNTESPDWLARLDALPEMCAVVGGPLRDKAYLQAKQAGALQKRVFFSFVPSLQKGDEGVVAWRFFPSQQDQIDALANFGINQLNLRNYGAFYPNDNYGKRMTGMLENTLAQNRVNLQKASYNPGAPASWSKAVTPLINPVFVGPKKEPVPQTTVEALFVPDSWKNMDMITTSLWANGEDRLILMGTTLWEPGLSGKQVPNAGKYELAIFPAAWNKNRAPKQLSGAGNDFFTALGFDFVNFASYMGLGGRPGPMEVAVSAQKSSPQIRALAPINWDSTGRARQSLYIFQVGSGGMKPANAEQLKRARTAAMERAALRIQNINSQPEDIPEPAAVEEEPAQQPEPPAAVTPQRQPTVATPPLSTVPQPSYKLRLPAKRP